MTLRHLKCTVLFILFSPTAHLLALDKTVTPEIKTEGMFWKVQSENATVYLLGSIHVAKPEFYPLPKVIEDAFKSAEKLVVEIDIQKDQLGMAMKMMQKAMYTGGETFSGSLSAETKKKWEEYQKENGIPGAAMEKFKPWFVAMSIMQIELGKLGYNPEIGIDMHFLKQARERTIEILELETADRQIELFSGMDARMQEEMFKYTIEEMSQMKSKIDEMFTQWKKGDDAGLGKLLADAFKRNKSFEQLEKKLINDRNRAMAAKVDEYLKGKGTYFVVVGAGHLIGEEGMVKLLEKKNYKIERK